MKKSDGFVYNSIKGIRIMFQAEPGRMLLQSLFTLMHGLSWTAQVLFTQRFFDAAQNLAQKNTGMTDCVIALVCMIAAYAFSQVMNGVDNCYSRILNIAMTRHINQKLFQRIDRLGCVEFEDTGRLDYINKAINGGASIVWVCLTLLDTTFFYATYFVSMGIYLFTLKPLLSISILVIFIPCFISNVVQIKSFRKLEDAAAQLRRECDYYESCVADIRETRLRGATAHFRNLFSSCLRRLNKLTLRAHLKKSAGALLADAFTVTGYAVILYMIVIMVLRQEISVGAFAAVLASIGMLFNSMNEVISERIGWAMENTAGLENYLSFVSEDAVATPELVACAQADIVLDGVSFKYPAAEKYALSNINLTIRNGQTLAVVGENGSGKTTLCRLLTGLYAPIAGHILVGGVATDSLSVENCSAIFQNYCRYKMTLKENVAISDTGRPPAEAEIEAVCRKAGIALDTMKDGAETMLGRDFDGAELSGGQWQRVAIARGIYRSSNFIVLDEPTAAIDPLEETRLYNEFVNICHGKTAVIVTHRLGSARIADCIVVMKDGRIAEQGTHDELIKHDGEYKRMYDLQSWWYRSNS